MIKGFKKELSQKFGKRINPILNKWINADYFKSAYKYGNNSNIPLNKKVKNTMGYLLRLISTKPPKTGMGKLILGLKIKTVKHLYLMLDRRYKLQIKINQQQAHKKNSNNPNT